jgi:hypothetical protein
VQVAVSEQLSHPVIKSLQALQTPVSIVQEEIQALHVSFTSHSEH